MPDGHQAPRSVSEACGSGLGLPRLGLSDKSCAWDPIFKAHRQSRVPVGAASKVHGHAPTRPRTAEFEGALAAAMLSPSRPSDELSHDFRKRSKEAPVATTGATTARSNHGKVPENDLAANAFQRRPCRLRSLHNDPVASQPQPTPRRRPRRVHTDPAVPWLRSPPAPPSVGGFPRHFRSRAEARPPAASPRQGTEPVPPAPRKPSARASSCDLTSPSAASQAHLQSPVEAPPRAASRRQSGEIPAPLTARTSSSTSHLCDLAAGLDTESEVEPRASLPGSPQRKSMAALSQVREEVLWEEIYGKLTDRDIGEVHTDSLEGALYLAGVSDPNSEWIKEITPQITHYSTLGQQEFFHFIEAYRRKQAEYYVAAFNSYGKDKSGRLELPELSRIFDCIGIDVTPHIMRELFEEVCKCERSIDVNGFMKMMELHKLREGFSRKEFEDLIYVFDLFDADRSDSIDATEFASMLSWLGFSLSREHDFRPPSLNRDGQEVYLAADTDGSGSLCQREFMKCMRMVRSLDVEKITRVIQENAMLGSEGRVQHAHLTRVFRALGYTLPDRQAIFESAQDCCGGDVHNGLDMGQVWQVVVQYRDRHGFSAAMKAEIQAAFDMCKTAHAVDIDHMQMPQVLRQLGFTLPLHVQRHITERVDVRCTGRIDLQSAVRIVRRACEHGLARAQQLFHLHKEDDPSGHTVISEEVALEVLDGMGLDDFEGGTAAWSAPPDDLAPGQGERRLSEEGFLRAYARRAEADRRRLQANGGLSGSELRLLQDVFNHHDRDGTGIVKDQSLMKMLQGSFSESGDALFRPRLLELMSRVSPDGGGLDFDGFRRFCQLYVEMREEDMLLKESHAIKQTSFSLAEVAELRSVFLATPGEPGTSRSDRLLLSWSELRLIVLGSHQRQCAEVVPPGRGWGDALKAFLQRPMPERAEEDEGAQFDFNEFLVILRAIADGRFASVL